MRSFEQTLTEKSYSRQMELSFAGCDRNRRVRVGTLLSFAADVAGYDYDARGLTYEKLFELGEVFLLSRIALRVHECPCVRDVLEVTTWEDGAHGAHMRRVFEMRDEHGKLRVSVKSDWILVDPKSRRILRPSAFTAKPIQVCGKEIDCPEPKKILLPREGVEELGTRQVRWSDLDGNGHLYSGNYGNIVWDYLPEALQDRPAREFFINYSKEAAPGQTLRLLGVSDGSDYLMEGIGPSGVCFSALCRF